MVFVLTLYMVTSSPIVFFMIWLNHDLETALGKYEELAKAAWE